MTERCWGEGKDREAARQLGLHEGDYSIFMMSCEVDYFEDIEQVEDEFAELGYVAAGEVIAAVQARIQPVQLPKGWVLVGMTPLGADAPRHYGIVDLSAIDN